MAIDVRVIGGRMALVLGTPKVIRGDYDKRYVEITREEAAALIASLCEGVGQMDGWQQHIKGEISNPTDCPNCNARNITPRHVCKKVKR